MVQAHQEGAPSLVILSPAPALPGCCLTVLLLELGLGWESALMGLQARSLMGKPALGFPVLPVAFLQHSWKDNGQQESVCSVFCNFVSFIGGKPSLKQLPDI